MPNEALRKRSDKTDYDLMDEWIGKLKSLNKQWHWQVNCDMQKIEDELGLRVLWDRFKDHSTLTKDERAALRELVFDRIVSAVDRQVGQLNARNHSGLRERIEALEASDKKHATNTANTHCEARECTRKLKYLMEWACRPWWKRLFDGPMIVSQLDEQVKKMANNIMRDGDHSRPV